jgi:hypothetical protein
MPARGRARTSAGVQAGARVLVWVRAYSACRSDNRSIPITQHSKDYACNTREEFFRVCEWWGWRSRARGLPKLKSGCAHVKMSMNIQLRLRSNKQLHVKNQGESIGMLIFAGGAVWEEKTSKNDTRVRSVATQEKGVRRVSRGQRVFKRI